MSLCIGVTGFIYAKAGNKEAVLINGYPVYEGDTIVATYSMETGDRVLSGYYSVINYNQDILEIYDVVSDEEHLSYSNNAKNEFRIIKTDAIDGFSYKEKTDVVKVYFRVKNTNESEYNITYKIREMYEYDKETMIDTPVADYKDMTFMQLSFLTSENQEEEPAETEEPSETEESVITEEPAEVTEEPAIIEEDEVPEAPEATELPEEEPKEEVTEEPVATKEPVVTEEPAVTKEPVVTEEPAATKEPVTETDKPAATMAPSNNNNNSGNTEGNTEDTKSFDDYYDEYFDNGPSVIIDDEGEILADTPSYVTGSENAVSTGDKTDVKSTIVMIIASLFGCGGVGGLILSTKRGY